jgi:hypothetical protein
MNKKDIEYIYERLKILQISNPGVHINTIFNIKTFLDILEKNVLIYDLKLPSDILIENTSLICLDWFKNYKSNKLDIMSLNFGGDDNFIFESYLDSLGTHTIKQCEIKEDLDELFLIHLKHFN